MQFKRIFLLVLDSLGVGEADDAHQYDDIGSNTLLNIINNYPINIPNMKKLGFYNILSITNQDPMAYYTKANPISNGKDTMVGHYELMGIKTDIPYKTWTDTGFPKDLIDEIEKQTGYKIIGNKAASGTEIINELGEEHIKSKAIIIYTSVDSVIQIATHEDIIPIKELYRICKIVREITKTDKWRVGRVIARPFKGVKGNFLRTGNRKDYALNPPSKTVLNYLEEKKYEVIAIGKIGEIFNYQGITKNIKTKDNEEGIKEFLKIFNSNFEGLCFINLNDFDTKYGHRRDIKGYAKALEEFDTYIPTLLNRLNDDDLFIITADHGNDPTYKGTDHTREKIPVIIYSKKFINNHKIADLKTFADIGASIAHNFNVQKPTVGESFINKLL